jgi:hypothetical protein
MNVFATYPCPVKSAKYLDVKRRNKMLIETCQLLSAACILNGISAPYKLSHKTHPTTKWASEGRDAYTWLLRHAIALSRDFKARTGKTHGCQKHLPHLAYNRLKMPSGPLKEFVNCARNQEKGVDFTSVADVHLAYRLYLRQRWKMDKLKPKWV